MLLLIAIEDVFAFSRGTFGEEFVFMERGFLRLLFCAFEIFSIRFKLDGFHDVFDQRRLNLIINLIVHRHGRT